MEKIFSFESPWVVFILMMNMFSTELIACNFRQVKQYWVSHIKILLFSISLKFFPKGTKARAVPPSRFRELRSHFKSPKPWPPNSSSKVVISVYLLLANSFEIISIYKISTSIMQSTPFIFIFLDKDI